MTTKRNGNGNGAGNGEGAGNGADPVRALGAYLASPGAAGLLASQKIALEATRFWARRMRAYADQLDVLARCTEPMQVVSAGASFVQRMQEDYAEEGRAVAELIKAAPADAEAASRAETAH
jgi:Phasin protein